MERRFSKTCTSRLRKAVFLLIGLLCCMNSVLAAPITVKGIVTSAADGEPLIGATVQVKGTKAAVNTDVNGAYAIKAEVGQFLVVSYVGYKTSETKVTGAVANIVLDENLSNLDEVVVVGYGVQKKKLVTGATAQMKGDDIARLNTANPLQAMQGQLPGVQITSTSGQPGSGLKVTIRGLGTIGDATPLYLIDGIAGDISTLNPNDIESIDVLKDAASAAIYGAQAANGVVLITTKQGQKGRSKVTFDAYYGWQNIARKAQLLNADEYMMIMDEQAINCGNAPYDWSSYQSIYDADGNIIDTDWVDSMIKHDATTQSYNLGFTGGNDNGSFLISLGYMDQEGVIGGKDVSNYERYNFRVNSDYKFLNNLLTVGEQVSFIYTKKTGFSAAGLYNNSFRATLAIPPLMPIYDADGNYYASDSNDFVNTSGNPYAALMTTTNNLSKNGNLYINGYAQLEPIPGLRIRTVLGMQYGNSESRSFTPIYHFGPYSYNDKTRVGQSMGTGMTFTWTNTIGYDWKIKEHAFNALVGIEAQRYKGSWLNGNQAELKEGFDTWPYAWISNGTVASTADGMGVSGASNDPSRRVSYFGRLGWNWQEKYMVNATLRADGSSKFARGHRFGYFPSVSAGWNISNENFWEPLRSTVDFLKIRASWGRVGNQNISNYQYVAPIKNSNTHYFFGEYIGANGTYNSYDTLLGSNWGAYPSRLSNEDVTWETSEQTNVGFDAHLINSRLGVNFDYYIKKTKDWLVVAPILATAGTGAPYINGGDVTNKGVELNLTWNDNIAGLGYSIGLNGAYNKNKVGVIPNQDGIIHGAGGTLYDNSGEFYRAENGHAIGYFWGLKHGGIFQTQEEIDEWIAAGNGTLQSDPKPGDVRFIDQNHDGAINEADKIDLGNGIPKFTYGFNINLFYKNFDFSVVASGAAGFKIVQSYRGHGRYGNYTKAVLARWTGAGTSNWIPRVTETIINYAQFSDLMMHDGDYLRISNVTLGYDFAKLINSKWCSQARLYFQIQNALTFTKYDGMDPELGYGTDSHSWVSGIDVGYYPRPRTCLFGVNLAF